MSLPVLAERLAALRRLLVERGLAALVVPSSDAHNSEYVRPCDMRRQAITGFSGSAGTAVITAGVAALWTDGRYWAQAAREAPSWTLMRDRLPETPSVEAWLASPAAGLPRGAVVGVDGGSMPLASVQRLRTALDAVGVRVDTRAGGGAHPVDAVWPERPPPPGAPLVPLPARVTGEAAASKLGRVRAALATAGADALVVTALDEVAWLLNVRGADVECNPVAIAYAVVHASAGAPTQLYIDAAKVEGEEVRAHLAAAGVALRPYEALAGDLAELRGRAWIDASAANFAVFEALTARKAAEAVPAAAEGAAPAPPTPPTPPPPPTILQQMSPLQLMKALKSEHEIAGMRAAHLRDGAALVAFFAWLEAALTRGVDLRAGGAPLAAPPTEHSVCAVLEAFRGEQADHAGPSFPTIAGYGANGAIIHYRPEAATAAALGAARVFLCDSGGQYLDGTTDVTRTLHFGAPSAHERRAYTRVLQGHVALARARFPAGASGAALDAIARAPMWADSLDYAHGTGHGVGAYLNVHEGPFGIAPQLRTAFEGGVAAGMCLSNEPGYYEEGAFGVRIENLVVVVPAPPPAAGHAPAGARPWLAFDNLTLVPMCRALTDAALLSREERAYLDGYHARCRLALLPLLAGNDAAADWLRRETEPLPPELPAAALA